jgi:hypothetical protein
MLKENVGYMILYSPPLPWGGFKKKWKSFGFKVQGKSNPRILGKQEQDIFCDLKVFKGSRKKKATRKTPRRLIQNWTTNQHLQDERDFFSKSKILHKYATVYIKNHRYLRVIVWQLVDAREL